MERVTEKNIYLKICQLNKSRMCVQYVTSREPAQQACDHMLIIANFFDSILCIVMFPIDVIKVFLCEVMPSNILKYFTVSVLQQLNNTMYGKSFSVVCHTQKLEMFVLLKGRYFITFLRNFLAVVNK